MQEERRTNKARADSTRRSLIDAARRLFTASSYAETGTPELVAAAGVTRGALYHHYADKRALFRAVVEAEAAALAAEIERATPADLGAREALLVGARAYLDAMAAPGRTRLLLLDGPSVLGRAEMDAIDERHGGRTLREGLSAAMLAGDMTILPLDALTGLLSAAFDRAALQIENGGSAPEQLLALAAMLDGLMAR